MKDMADTLADLESMTDGELFEAHADADGELHHILQQMKACREGTIPRPADWYPRAMSAMIHIRKRRDKIASVMRRRENPPVNKTDAQVSNLKGQIDRLKEHIANMTAYHMAKRQKIQDACDRESYTLRRIMAFAEEKGIARDEILSAATLARSEFDGK